MCKSEGACRLLVDQRSERVRRRRREGGVEHLVCRKNKDVEVCRTEPSELHFDENLIYSV